MSNDTKMPSFFKKASETFFKSKKKKVTWKDLEETEERRQNILKCGGGSLWKVLFHWDGTVFQQIYCDPLFWIAIALFVGIRLDLHLGEGSNDMASYVKSEDLAIVGGFLTFFLVFYVNQNHNAFFECYGNSMACKGRIFDVASLAVATLPKTRALRLVRYMNAAHAAGYAGLSKVYNDNNFFKIVNEKTCLLTTKELARMNEIGVDDEKTKGSCTRELIAWCLVEVERAKHDRLLDQESVSELRSQVLQLRGKIGEIYNAAALPLPFFYVHFLCFLTALYVPLFAVSAAVKAGTEKVYCDLLAGLIVILQSIFVIGLRVLGEKMSDPYGNDITDLNVIPFVKSTWIQSNRILESKESPEYQSYDAEHTLKENRGWSLGLPWGEFHCSSCEEGPGDEESMIQLTLSDDSTEIEGD